MNKKLIKTIASITCGLGIVGSIPFATTCCGCSTKKNNSLPESVYSFSNDGKTLLGFKEGVNLSQYEGVCDTMQIPARVTSIAELAFVNDAFAQKASSAIPEFITKLDFAKGSQCFLIGLGAFAFCSTLTTVNLPNSLIKLDNSVFHKCSSLTSVDFSNSTIFSSIGQEVFSYCLSLTSITLPSCLIEIGSDAFSGSNLSTIT
ncbi:MAG: leucine-rich repeat domain-containing protein [Mycoplasmoidaceae bacterium]|nr:leucine-rich repeat domain-containing protein [Mycoplasmoidaceae bacterium]